MCKEVADAVADVIVVKICGSVRPIRFVCKETAVVVPGR